MTDYVLLRLLLSSFPPGLVISQGGFGISDGLSAVFANPVFRPATTGFHLSTVCRRLFHSVFFSLGFFAEATRAFSPVTEPDFPPFLPH